MIATIVASGVVFLDGTAVNVALPALRSDLNATLADQEWVVAGYLLTLASLLLLGGSLGDRLGRRRIFIAGLIGFGITSLLCALAPNIEFLIAARILQGVAGALLVPSSLATITETFGEGERGAAIGSWTAWSGITTVIGPVAGGALVEFVSWRAIFALNLPFIALALWLTYKAVPKREGDRNGHVDAVGGLLCALGLGGIVFALIEQPLRGWGDLTVWGPATIGALILVLFVIHEHRSRDPMLPPSLFRARNFAFGNLSTLFVYAGLAAGMFFLAVFLQETAGFGALKAGLVLLPVSLMLFFLSRQFGKLYDRVGPRLLMTVGPIIAGIGLSTISFIGADVAPVPLAIGVVLFGLGLSMTVAPLTSTVLASVPVSRAGVASGVNNAIARGSGLLAIAIVGSFLTSQAVTKLDSELGDQHLSVSSVVVLDQVRKNPLAGPGLDSVPPSERDVVADASQAAAVSGFHVGVGFAGVLMVIGGVVALVGIRNPRRGELGDASATS